MLLRNTERYVDLLEVSAETAQLRRYAILEGERASTAGFFFEHDRSLFGLGVSAGSLWVLVGSTLQECASDLQSEVREGDGVREFRIQKNGTRLVDVTYEPNRPFWNFFHMEDEDVDGFLLLHNIMSNQERRAVFVSANGG